MMQQILQAAQSAAPATAPSWQDMAAQSGYIIFGIQLLKKWKILGFINDHSDSLNRALSVFLSAVTTVGLSYHWDPNVGQFTFGGFQTGVTWYVALLAMTWKISASITTTHMIYHGAVKNGMASKIIDGVTAAIKATNGGQKAPETPKV